MTIRDIALLILRDFGVSTLNPATNENNRNARGITDGDLQAVVFHVNGALEEIYNDGPAAISEKPLGDVLRPETAVTVTATQYSRTISALTTFESWMVGCTFRIAGDANDNQLLSATELVRPYMGSSGSGKTGQVWGDALLLPSNASHLLPPIRLIGQDDLELVGTKTEFQPRGSSTPKCAGTPERAFVDTWHDQTEGVTYLKKLLRVDPMPSQAFAVDFTVKLTPPVIEVEDIDEGDHTADPEVVLPTDWLNSVLLPIARQRASSDPLFVNQDGKPEIARQFNIARAILKGQTPGRGAQRGIYK